MITVSKEAVDLATVIGGFSSGLAVLGALAAIWQLRMLKQQSRTTFEDSLVEVAVEHRQGRPGLCDGKFSAQQGVQR